MSKNQPRKQEQPAKQQPTPEPVIPKNIMKPQPFIPSSKNVGSATFSNIAKQAESIVSGDNSIVFNNYNNNAVFRSSRVDMNDCVSVDAVSRSIKNVNDINFVDKSTLKGICDGYVLNSQGTKILLNDKNIALSTAFSYKLMNELAKTNANIKLESSKREESHNQLHSMIKDLEENEVHDKDMLIKGSLTLSKSLKVDGFGIRTDDVNWAALTMNDIDWMSFDYVNDKINMYKPVEFTKQLTVSKQLTVNDNIEATGIYMKINGDSSKRGYRMYFAANDTLWLYNRDAASSHKLWTGSQTITHITNVNGDIGTFCESTGEIYDGYDKTASTDCICQVKTANGLNPRIVGIICAKNEFASHGDVLVKVVPDNYELGDILVPTENGYGRKATEEEELFMMRKAIPRPKITSLNTGIANTVACFVI